MISIPITGSIACNRKIRHLCRIDVTENAGSPAVARVLLRDVDQNGAIVGDVRIAASDSRHLTFDPPLPFPGGLYVQVSTGTVRGSVTGQ